MKPNNQSAITIEVEGKKRIIKSVRRYEENSVLWATYKGYDIEIERDDDESEGDEMYYAHVTNYKAFGVVVDGMFFGPMEDVIKLCIKNILN